MINDELNRIRMQNGKDPINPSIIEGFGPNDPPPPREWLEPERDVAPPSPLIPRREPKPEPEPLPMPVFHLVVLDGAASWKGREVILSNADIAAIRIIVINAIKKTVQDDLEAAITLMEVDKPRRGRKKKA